MSARARVEADFIRNGVAIYLGRQFQDSGTMIARIDSSVSGPTLIFEPSRPGIAIGEPSLRLPDDLARALYDALALHYGDTSDVQTLRRDYLAERERVDKMIAYLTAPQTLNLGGDS